LDEGLPIKDFLRVYPETNSSTSDGTWAELPGYPTGQIAFMTLLNGEGLTGYLRNEDIWPGHWWMTPNCRQQMFFGGQEGLRFMMEQRFWYLTQDRDREEEEFLTQVIMGMVGAFGQLTWEGFQWSLQKEQQCLGESYTAFWKDWEDSAFHL
jgi:hypothetical protein